MSYSSMSVGNCCASSEAEGKGGRGMARTRNWPDSHETYVAKGRWPEQNDVEDQLQDT